MKKTTTKTKAEKIAKEVLQAERNEVTIIEHAPAPVAQSHITTAALQVADVMQRAISNTRLDVKKMREILDMQMEVMRFQSELAYNRSMVEAQGLMPQIEATRDNKSTTSKFASLDDIDTIIKPIYIKHGFSLTFTTENVSERFIKVICLVRHIDGHKESHELTGEIDDKGFKGSSNKTGIQGAGSSVSYMQRYLTKLIFNVVIKGEDKDGNSSKKPAEESDQFAKRMNLPDQAKQMMADMEKLKTQKERLDLVSHNAPFLRNLDDAGHTGLVSDIHALADKGA
jgi:hypothetical protein